MLSFSTHFLICNIFIALIISILLIAKRILKNYLSGRTQYNFCFLIFMILSVPFFSFRPSGILQFFSLFGFLKEKSIQNANIINPTSSPVPSTNWLNDFSISITEKSPGILNYMLAGIWLLGMIIIIVFMIKSRIRLYHLEQSALPLQNPKVDALFKKCIQELKIHKHISIYSTAFLQSPVLVGFIKPRIYLPIHLISDFNANEIRYMILHELQHYKHKDPIINHFINIAGILYWFNPFVWYSLKEMRNDCEVACDSSVLQILDSDNYIDYGNTLINFAEKISLTPFSFSNGMGGGMKQMKRRILNIAAYRHESKWRKLRSNCIFLLVALFIIESMALFPVQAAYDHFSLPTQETISYVDFSSFFKGYNGCFVLYDSNSDAWQIYNKSLATKRISPDSTYKIYSALLGLENQFIMPNATEMNWDGQNHYYSQWNQNQTLTSAMQNSVNWYFQTLDHKAGLTELNRFYKKLNYGNHNLSGGIDNFWMESSLKISAFEQVQLLKKLYTNEFHFKEQNVQAVKDALRLSVSEIGTLYGKTGTGAINGKNVNGWFVGYLESAYNTYFFATNICDSDKASGITASEITLKILHERKLLR